MGALQNGGTWENHRKIMDKNMGTILQMEFFFIIPYAPCMVYLPTKLGNFWGKCR
jgi:hypothetical protein